MFYLTAFDPTYGLKEMIASGFVYGGSTFDECMIEKDSGIESGYANVQIRFTSPQGVQFWVSPGKSIEYSEIHIKESMGGANMSHEEIEAIRDYMRHISYWFNFKNSDEEEGRVFVFDSFDMKFVPVSKHNIKVDEKEVE